MKKFNLFSVASLIRGRKSDGVEDYSSLLKHWRKNIVDPCESQC